MDKTRLKKPIFFIEWATKKRSHKAEALQEQRLHKMSWIYRGQSGETSRSKRSSSSRCA